MRVDRVILIIKLPAPAVRLCYEQRNKKDCTVPILLSELLARGTSQLRDAGIVDSEVDAELLAGHVLDESRGGIQAAQLMGVVVDDAQAENIQALFDRRALREPLQHITGLASFRYLELQVGPGVFVPRPETELVTQVALDLLKSVTESPAISDGSDHTELIRVVDFCTGSGAIALSVASEVPTAKVWGVEKSVDAFEWAQKNAQRLGLKNLTLLLGEVRGSLHELDGQVTAVISNPPYIPTDAVPRDPEVRFFDPHIALFGGVDGLDVVRDVSEAAFRLLKSGGVLVLEHGELQGPAIAELLRSQGFSDVRTHLDFTQRDRATSARK